MLKGLFFDIGYTLCRMNTGDWRATDKFFEYIPREYMAGLSPDIIASAYEAANAVQTTWNFVWNLEEEVRMHVEIYRAMIQKFPGISVSEADLKEIAYDRTYNMDNYVFYEGVPEVLQELSQHYKIGIISDTWPSADAVLRKAGVYDCIDSFTYSCYLGVTKPDVKMYRNAIENIGLSGHETLFVDDSVRNLEAAARLGIRPVLVLTKEQKGVSSFTEIEKLEELVEIVKG